MNTMKRISTKLYGRIGNQMFQIATAWAYAQDKGLEFILPNSTLNTKEWPFYWTGNNDLGFKRIMDFEGIPLEIIYKDLKPGYHPIPHYTDFIGPGFFNLITFDGYWQSYKYFDKYKSELIKLFKFDDQGKSDKMNDYVAIHVRRGDYVQHAEKFPPITPEYINSAIELFNGYHRYKFMVFSDDIHWCRENIKSEEEGNEICYYDNSGDDIADQKAMGQCAGFIISNSTYSWWPAYLSEKNKIVIAPKLWYGQGNAHIAHNDLLPDNWITI